MSQKGYALNKLGASLISDDARATFKANEESYMNKFGLNEEQKNWYTIEIGLDVFEAALTYIFFIK